MSPGTSSSAQPPPSLLSQLTPRQVQLLQRVISTLPSTSSTWEDYDTACTGLGLEDDWYWAIGFELSTREGRFWIEKWTRFLKLRERDTSGSEREQGEVGMYRNTKSFGTAQEGAAPVPKTRPIPSQLRSRTASHLDSKLPPPTPTRREFLRPAINGVYTSSSEEERVRGYSSADRQRVRVSAKTTRTPASQSYNEYPAVPPPRIPGHQQRPQSEAHLRPSSNSHSNPSQPDLNDPYPIEPLSEADSVYLELRASTSRAVFLTSNYWCIWRDMLLARRRRENDIYTGAERRLQRVCLSTWRDTLVRVKEDELRRKEEEERRRVEEEIESKRRKEERRRMSLLGLEQKGEEYLMERKRRLGVQMMKRWKMAMMSSIDARYKVSMKEAVRRTAAKVKAKEGRAALKKWQHLTGIHILEGQALAFDYKRILKQWRLRLEGIGKLDTEASYSNEERLARSGLKALSTALNHNKYKEKCALLFQQRNVFQKWRQATEDRQRLSNLLESRARQLASENASNLLRTSFGIWHLTTLAASQRAHFLSLSDASLRQNAWKVWSDRHRHIQVTLEGKGIGLKEHKEKSLKTEIWGIWRNVINARKDNEHEATLVLQAKDADRAKRVLKAWKGKLDEVEEQTRKGEVARAHLLSRSHLGIWRKATEKKRLEHLLREKEEETQLRVLSKWRNAVCEIRSNEARVEEFKAQIELKYKREVFNLWENRTIEIRDREIDAPIAFWEQSDERLQLRTLQHWRNVREKYAKQMVKADTARFLDDEKRKKATLPLWRQATVLHIRMEILLLEKEERLMETAYAHWRYLSLVQLEGPIVDMRDERLASGAFAKWKKKTMAIPAIEFYREMTRGRYLKKWRAATTDPELVKKAVEINRQIVKRVSGTCLQIWRIKQQSRTALRSVNQRFRLSTSTRNSSFRSSSTSSPPSTPTFSPRSSSNGPEHERTSGARSPSRFSTPPTSLFQAVTQSRISSPSSPSPSPSGNNSREEQRPAALRARLRAAASANRS